MGTDFSFETVFRAPSVKFVLAAYFDADHLAAQDMIAELADRRVIDHHEDDDVRTCSWSVHARRTLPLYARPFVDGGRVNYVETMKWRKRDDEIDETIVPQILGGRIQITSLYQLAQVGDGQVRRRFSGTIAVNVKLLSARIERAILNEIEKGIPMLTECTQNWLLKGSSV